MCWAKEHNTNKGIFNSFNNLNNIYTYNFLVIYAKYSFDWLITIYFFLLLLLHFMPRKPLHHQRRITKIWNSFFVWCIYLLKTWQKNRPQTMFKTHSNLPFLVFLFSDIDIYNKEIWLLVFVDILIWEDKSSWFFNVFSLETWAAISWFLGSMTCSKK